MPSHLPIEVRRRLEPIRALVLDVDGVLTDGGLRYGADGEVLKQFSARDGLAIRLLERAGIHVAILSGRSHPAVTARCRELGLMPELVIQGSHDKDADLDRIEGLLGVGDEAVAAMGDDLPDLPMLKRAGFSVCPADAAPEVVAVCHWVCGASGGAGAVREIGELLLKAQRRWMEQVGEWLEGVAAGDDG